MCAGGMISEVYHFHVFQCCTCVVTGYTTFVSSRKCLSIQGRVISFLTFEYLSTQYVLWTRTIVSTRVGLKLVGDDW